MTSVCFHLVTWYTLYVHFGDFFYSCIHHYCKINQMWTKAKATWMTQKLRFELPKQAVKQFLLVRVIVRKITATNFISSKFLKDLEMWLLECRVYRTLCSLIIHRCKLPCFGSILRYWKDALVSNMLPLLLSGQSAFSSQRKSLTVCILS